jgi:hypothetical protein
MSIPSPFDKFEPLIDVQGRVVTVHNVEPVGEKEIQEGYREMSRDFRRLGISWRDYLRAARETFPSGGALAVGIVGEERMALLDAWTCYREESAENLPYERL